MNDRSIYRRVGSRVLILLLAACCTVPVAVAGSDRGPLRSGPLKPAYPSDAYRNGIEGKVVLEFDVTKRGRAKNIRIVEAVPEGVFEDSATRVVKFHRWLPARKNGKPVHFEGHVIHLQYFRRSAEELFKPSGDYACAPIWVECNASKYGCLFLYRNQDSETCDLKCTSEVRRRLLENGVTLRTDHSSYIVEGKGGCIGIRKDLGGTEAGARCLAKILGPGYAPGQCNSAGWPYTVVTP